MEVVVGLLALVVVAFALLPAAAAAASAVEDFMTRRAYEDLVKSGAINGVANFDKTIISNPILEEALLAVGGRSNCGESCYRGVCHRKGCRCRKYHICQRDTVDEQEAHLVAFSSRKAFGGLAK